VEHGGELLVEADVTLALVDRERLTPARFPPKLATVLGAVQTKAFK
jgi:acyl-CoA thioesterase FadM